MDMSPTTPSELDSYPHVFITSDMQWKPQSIIDEYPVQDLDLTDNALQHNEYHPDTINAYGELLSVARLQDIYLRRQRRNQHDIDQLSPFSCCANVSRLNEVVATKTYFSDYPTLDVGLLGHGGTKMVQLVCGCQSLFTAVYPMRKEGNISGTLEDFISQFGAPNSLFSDNAKDKISKAI
jgi:hypothetical protein